MRSVLMALVALALLGLNAWASVPDADYCTVTPQDAWANPKLVGIPWAGALRADGDITVHIAAFGGEPIANSEVLVVINPACGGVTNECSAWVNPGYTDASGNLTMNLRYGGCCQMGAAATIYADGTPIRSYTIITSPDWSGSASDAVVGLPDFSLLAASYGDVSPCSDFVGGDNAVGLPDFSFFAGHYGDNCTVAP